jgi:endonuclease YncB( thermonuclease family)
MIAPLWYPAPASENHVEIEVIGVKRTVLFLSLLLILLIILPCHSLAWSGKVVGVADGDTITVLRDKQQVRIRFYGIDCPEGGQAFSKKAKQFTSDKVFGKVVEVEPVDVDRYGRTVALVAVFRRLVNEELVNAGFAWVYTRYCDRPICERWKVLEQEAREANRGLWADPNPIPPWEFRKKERKGGK